MEHGGSAKTKFPPLKLYTCEQRIARYSLAASGRSRNVARIEIHMLATGRTQDTESYCRIFCHYVGAEIPSLKYCTSMREVTMHYFLNDAYILRQKPPMLTYSSLFPTHFYC